MLIIGDSLNVTRECERLPNSVDIRPFVGESRTTARAGKYCIVREVVSKSGLPVVLQKFIFVWHFGFHGFLCGVFQASCLSGSMRVLLSCKYPYKTYFVVFNYLTGLEINPWYYV